MEVKMLVVNARFLTQPISGVQRYAIEVCLELKKIIPDLTFVAPKNINHHDVANELGVQIIGNLLGHLWEQVDLPLYLKKRGSPLLLNLCNTAPLFYDNKITVVHDVAFERFPQSFSWKFRYAYQIAIPKIIKTSKVIITDSDFSRDELASLYKLNKKYINIVHCATSRTFRALDSSSTDKYVLAVSSLNYQKNFHSLIKAFNKIDDTNVKLYLVGAVNPNFANHQLLDDIKSNSRITFLGRVDDEVLVQLYSDAVCFVYPSLYEGFGIPPLEAQACGCPVITSNAASLPEVCGDSVIYCDPYSVDDITNKINMVLSDDALQKELRARGFENIKRFSWEKSAQQIINIIEEIK
jgi:glycosyltransferase involved in cell wall biosynthesis